MGNIFIHLKVHIPQKSVLSIGSDKHCEAPCVPCTHKCEILRAQAIGSTKKDNNGQCVFLQTFHPTRPSFPNSTYTLCTLPEASEVYVVYQENIKSGNKVS